MITNVKNIKDITETIALLESNKRQLKHEISEDFHQKFESLKPANLVRSVTGNVMAKSPLQKGLLLTAAGIGGALIIKNIFTKRSSNKGLIYMALSGAGTMLLKKILAKSISRF